MQWRMDDLRSVSTSHAHACEAPKLLDARAQNDSRARSVAKTARNEYPKRSALATQSRRRDVRSARRAVRAAESVTPM
jgi:hypothetical protein